MIDAPTIIEAIDSPELFAPWFRGPSWAAWRAFLALLFGVAMDEAQDMMCSIATGRVMMPGEPFTQAWVCVGRRGGKSLISALVAVYVAVFRDYTPFLAPGEVATVMLVAADRKQARVVLRFIRAFIREVPMLAALVVRETMDTIELANRVVIEVHTASFRTVRGYTLAAVINDEICWWPTDENAAEPDKEILAAQRPALTTIPGALMLNISSPYARRGSMFAAYEKHFGQEESDVLFWKAPSRALPEHEALVEMNPSIDLRLVEQAYADDATAASSEFGGNFRTDVEQLFTLEMLNRVTDYDRPPILPPCFEEAAR
jgi:phage terminase large subunit-like protein